MVKKKKKKLSCNEFPKDVTDKLLSWPYRCLRNGNTWQTNMLYLVPFKISRINNG